MGTEPVPFTVTLCVPARRLASLLNIIYLKFIYQFKLYICEALRKMNYYSLFMPLGNKLKGGIEFCYLTHNVSKIYQCLKDRVSVTMSFHQPRWNALKMEWCIENRVP